MIVLPESRDSFILISILNYNGFPHNVEEDNILRQKIKREMKYEKDEEYPLIIMDSSLDEMPNA